MCKKFIKMSRNFTIDESFEIFKTECLTRGLSSETIRWYNETIKFFSNFHNINNSVDSLDEKLISDYIIFCFNKGNKKSTINNRLIAIKSFLNWLYKTNKIKEKVDINLIKDNRVVKDTYTQDELEKLLRKPDIYSCDFTEYRDWVISNLFLSVACRVATLVNIKIKDLDLKNCELLYTHTKNCRQQIIPLTKYMTSILKEYLTYRKGSKDDFLFCNRYSQPLTKNALRISLNKYNKRRGVNRTGRHIYRNTFAKIWILNGGDAFRLQKLLGHSTMEMTKRYIEMYSDDLKVDMENFNPINTVIKNKKLRIKMKKYD